MLSIEMSSKDLISNITKILRTQEQMFKDALIHVLKLDFLPRYLDTFSQVYQEMLVSPFEGSMSADDKTAPSKLKSAVIKKIETDIQNKLSMLSTKKKTIELHAIHESLFAFPSGPEPSDTDPVKLFYFYLVGTPGEFAFVSAENIDRWRAARARVKIPRRRTSGLPLGRFNVGFMVPMGEYTLVYQQDNSLPSPSAARHPFSGSGPIHIFEEVVRRINFNIFIEKAVLLMKKT